jgi:hypothetical protein
MIVRTGLFGRGVKMRRASNLFNLVLPDYFRRAIRDTVKRLAQQKLRRQ